MDYVVDEHCVIRASCFSEQPDPMLVMTDIRTSKCLVGRRESWKRKETWKIASFSQVIGHRTQGVLGKDSRSEEARKGS